MERYNRTVKPSSEFEAFDALLRKVLTVPHAEIVRREAEYKKQAAQNPKRRGPKPKVKPSSGPGPADEDQP